MKLGKEALLAITEIALFLTGAVFFLLILILPTTPMWALIVGILFGLAGALLWAGSLLAKFRHRDQNAVHDISQKIQGAGSPENNTYELHRADSYDNQNRNYQNIADEVTTTPTQSSADQPAAE